MGFVVLAIIGIIIILCGQLFKTIFQGVLGKIALSAVVVSIGTVIVSEIVFDYTHKTLSFIATGCVALAIVIIVTQVIINIFKK